MCNGQRSTVNGKFGESSVLCVEDAREKRQRTRTGRGPHDIIQRNGRGPDAGSAVSPRCTESQNRVQK
eukprot:gene12983-biopygen9527